MRPDSSVSALPTKGVRIAVPRQFANEAVRALQSTRIGHLLMKSAGFVSVVQTEARAHSFGRGEASVEVSLQSTHDRIVRFPERANEAVFEGFFVHGVCPCAQVQFAGRGECYLIGWDEHDNLHNIENVRG
jgi:hypothetical protein